MANLTKQQIKEMIDKRPPGTTPAGIVNVLRKRGHILEGYNEEVKEKPRTAVMPKTAEFLDTLFGGGEIGEFVGAKVGKFLPESLGGFQEGAEQYYDTQGPGAKALIGDILKTLATPATLSITKVPKLVSTVGARLATGATIGGVYGGAEAAREDESIVKGVYKGAKTGLIFTGVLEGLGKTFRLMSQTKWMQRRTGATYSKELQPPMKELTRDIIHDFKRFGEEVADIKQEGNPVYLGTYQKLKDTASKEVSQQGQKLEGLLENFVAQNPKAAYTRNEVVKDVFPKLQDMYGELTPTQIRQMDFEIKRMVEPALDVLDMQRYKSSYDNLIPETYWVKIDDPALAYPSTIRYLIRDSLRTAINQITSNPEIQQVNHRLHVAYDVRKLAAQQIAKRAIQKAGVQGKNPLSYMFSKIFDDFIFNPSITLRTSQITRQAGTKVGQTPIRQLGRVAGIRALVGE